MPTFRANALHTPRKITNVQFTTTHRMIFISSKSYGINRSRPTVQASSDITMRLYIVKAPITSLKTGRCDTVGIIQVFSHPGLATDFHGLINLPITAINNGIVLNIRIKISFFRNTPVDIHPGINYRRIAILVHPDTIYKLVCKIRDIINITGIAHFFKIIA